MAMNGAARQALYRVRARERGQALEQLPPIPGSQRAAIARVVALEITKTRGRIASLQRKRGADAAQERRDLERVVDFWRELAAKQGLEAGDDAAAGIA